MAETTNPATDEVGAGSEDAETVHQANARLRYAWLSATLDATIAASTGDLVEADQAQARADAIREEFFLANRRLAMAAAKGFLRHARGEDLKDHEQAALMGLWEAFAGTDPIKGRTIAFDENGNPVAEAGWDPAKATFGTFSRTYVQGKVRRSVATVESGLSYALWSYRPAVLAARDALIAEGFASPSPKQVAKKANLSLDTVTAIMTPNATSLQVPIGTDGATLGDMLADEADHSQVFADFSENTALIKAAAQRMSIGDLFSYGLTNGIMGRRGLTVVEAAARLGIGRGAVVSGCQRAQIQLELTASAAAIGLAALGMVRRREQMTLLLRYPQVLTPRSATLTAVEEKRRAKASTRKKAQAKP